jgi:hypothetical protein
MSYAFNADMRERLEYRGEEGMYTNMYVFVCYQINPRVPLYPQSRFIFCHL